MGVSPEVSVGLQFTRQPEERLPEDSGPVSANDRWPFGPQESSLQNDANKTLPAALAAL